MGSYLSPFFLADTGIPIGSMFSPLLYFTYTANLPHQFPSLRLLLVTKDILLAEINYFINPTTTTPLLCMHMWGIYICQFGLLSIDKESVFLFVIEIFQYNFNVYLRFGILGLSLCTV